MSKKAPDLPEIFCAAVEIQDEKERTQLVEQMTQEPEVRKQVFELLQAHELANSFLATPPPELDRTRLPLNSAESANASMMASLKSNLSISPVVLRDESPEDFEPMIRPSSPEIPSRSPDDKYQVQGEIARGGMGAILQGRDVDLGRSLAIKVLLDDHKENPQIIQRFIEEAQIGGQLQHPGITPVYELGQFDDHRPFFTMKLVKGKTLAAMLTDRTEVSERGKLLGICEQICQTMAYAHSRGVIHRDLKPANIMVGAFGEVQVMDWGLAKVLESGGTADEKKARQQHVAHSVIHTYRSDGSGPAMVGTDPANAGETLAGSVMGTPAYMPPEQARGEIDRLDERCDVFGLGAILCEILTGRPPYFDDNPKTIIYLAMEGNLETAFNNLDQCQADSELIEITKECLTADPTKRIRDAQVLADRISGYLEGVESKLQETELARVKEATRAVEARKRQRVTMALAASILLMIGLGTAAWMWNQNQLNHRRVVATNRVNDALGEARLQLGLAESALTESKVNELEKALASAKTANELADNDAVDPSLKKTTDELVVDLQQTLEKAIQQAKLAEADRKLKEELEFIRLSHADGKQQIDTRRGQQSSANFNKLETRQKYLLAFRAAGHDFQQQSDSEIADWVARSEIRESLISAMDHWGQCLPTQHSFQSSYPWIQAKSWEEATQIAKRLRNSQPDASLNWMVYGGLLAKSEDDEAYRHFCKEMLWKFKNAVSHSHQERLCKMCLFKPDMVDIEILPTAWETVLEDGRLPQSGNGWLPWAWNARALLALRKGDFETSLEYVDKSETFEPMQINQTLNHCVRTLAAHHLGEKELAAKSLQESERSLRSAMKLSAIFHHDFIFARLMIAEAEQLIQPGEPTARFPLDRFPRKASAAGSASIQSTLSDSSINHRLFKIANLVDDSELRKSVRTALFEGDTELLKNTARDSRIIEQPPEILAALAAALRGAKELPLAESVLRDALPQYPGDFWLNFEMGQCLIEQEKVEEGIGYARSALAVRPTSDGAIWLVTAALLDANRNDEALRQFKVLLDKKNLSASGYYGLARSMKDYGHWEAAELAVRKASESEPENSLYLAFHSEILSDLGKTSEAFELLDEAIGIDPDSMFAMGAYVRLLWKTGQEEAAIQQVQKLIEKHPERGFFYSILGKYLEQTGKYEEALESHKKAVELAPESQAFRADLASAYSKLGMFDEASEQQTLSIEGYSKLEESLRRVLALDTRSADAHYDLGYNLYQQRRYKEAAESYKKSIEIDDKVPTRFYKYGYALWFLDQKDEAIAQWKRALDLNPKLAKYHERVGWAYKETQRFEEAIPYYETAVELNPDFDHAKQQLALVRKLVGRTEDELAFARKAVEEEPDNPKLYLNLAMKLRQKGDLIESEEQLHQAIALNPKQVSNYVVFLGEIQASQGNVQRAIETLESAIKKEEHPNLHVGLANVLWNSAGDLKRAEIEYRKALETGNNMQQRFARIGLTELLTAMERFDDAEKLFAVDESRIHFFPLLHCQQIYAQFLAGKDKASALNAIEEYISQRPKRQVGYVTWAKMLIHEPDEQGNYPDAEQAIELATKACEIRPYDMSTRTVLGQAQYRAGNIEAAIETLEQALQLGSRHPDVWLFLAMSYAELGNSEKAIEFHEQTKDWIAKMSGRIPRLDRILLEAERKISHD